MKKAVKILSALFLLSPLSSLSTTFGPISLVEQIEKSQYFLSGKIIRGPWPELEREFRKPFTHWELEIEEQFTGNSLGKQVIIRQPGGEINGIGYHVAGTAQFSVGETVFVTVRDTSEANVKEVVGLASGKYRVSTTNGIETIQNGLGLPVLLRGKNADKKTFSKFIKKIASGKADEADRKIILNENFTEDKNSHLEDQVKQALTLKEEKKKAEKTSLQESSPTAAKPFQKEFQYSEESSDSGVWKIPVALAALVFLVGIVIIIRRR